MKHRNFKFMIVVVLALSLVTSCSKEEAQPEKKATAEAVSVKDGMLTFADTKALDSVTNILKEKDEDQINQWGRNYAYVSFHSAKAQRDFDRYNGILEDKSPSILDTTDLPILLQTIANSKGAFRVADVVYLCRGNRIYNAHANEVSDNNIDMSKLSYTVITKKIAQNNVSKLKDGSTSKVKIFTVSGMYFRYSFVLSIYKYTLTNWYLQSSFYHIGNLRTILEYYDNGDQRWEEAGEALTIRNNYSYTFYSSLYNGGATAISGSTNQNYKNQQFMYHVFSGTVYEDCDDISISGTLFVSAYVGGVRQYVDFSVTGYPIFRVIDKNSF